ncbi:hypothetical protein GIB67_036220 [Kingdonia uniflora]|uniref:Myb-like domain-containing protein n=1 Tax=Kingdonia uniflora TaxID=39325 RepID=A0A7J7LF04_9MAGN|nr:hypothetical protein GIB67_036220 [Kingdonia uniflora]
MDYFDEESRPKFLFQSKFSSMPITPQKPQQINKTLTAICISTSTLLTLLSIFFLQSETPKFLTLWISLSLLIGPFAPISITGGDIRVGHGDLLPEPVDLDNGVLSDGLVEEPRKRRGKSKKPEELSMPMATQRVGVGGNGGTGEKRVSSEVKSNGSMGIIEEQEWGDVDLDLLKKQISKHPVGEPRRWELITKAFGGRHKLESVIKTAKSFSEKKLGDGDSFSQFLKQRKPLDKRAEASNGEVMDNEVRKESDWSSGEDIALLNALKVFPKDVAMRWDKIAAAVPGKTKACCMKRVSELKRDFRSSKA